MGRVMLTRQLRNNLLSSLRSPQPLLARTLACLLFAGLACPIWLQEYVPLVDYPAHLARTEILFLYDQVPAFQDTYVIDHRLIPNLAMDLVAPRLRHYFSLQVSGKLFLTGIFALYCAAMLALSSVLQARMSLRAFLLWPMFYNSQLLWGFVNYVAGACLFFAWAALLLHTASAPDRRWQPVRYALLIAGAIACYAAHLTAFLMCCVAWTTLVVRALAVEKRLSPELLLCGLALPLPVLHYLSLLTSGQFGAGPEITAFNFDWRPKLLQLGAFSRGYDWQQDLLPTVLLLAAAGYCLARGWRTLLASRAAWIAFGLMAAFLLLPMRGNRSTGSGFDVRFFWPAVVLLVFALRSAGWSSREKLLVALLAGSAWVIRLGYLESNWRALSDASAQMVTLLDTIPEGSRVYPLCGSFSASDAGKRNAALCHVVSYGIPRRHLIDLSFFSFPGAQPVLFRSKPHYSDLGSIQEISNDEYVWASVERPRAATYLTAHAQRIAVAGGYVLWRMPGASEHSAGVTDTPLPSAGNPGSGESVDLDAGRGDAARVRAP